MSRLLRTDFLPCYIQPATGGQEPQIKLRLYESIREGAWINGTYLGSLEQLFQERG